MAEVSANVMVSLSELSLASVSRARRTERKLPFSPQTSQPGRDEQKGGQCGLGLDSPASSGHKRPVFDFTGGQKTSNKQKGRRFQSSAVGEVDELVSHLPVL